MASDEGTGLRALLCQYQIDPVKRVSRAGGTAGKTWRVTTSTSEYLLRLRGMRTSSDGHLGFDHALRAHLVARGIPTTEAIVTRQGERWVRRHGRVYELYPLVTGRPFDARQVQELVRAAQALATFHRAASSFQPPASWRQVVAQYTSLGFSARVSDRMDDPDLQLVNLQGVRDLAVTAEQVLIIDRCMDRVRALQQTYGRAAYDRLAGYVIHGDYTPANVLYSAEGEIVGIFDFDWAMHGPRCLDVAYGICFFATEPRQIDGASIWSLTDAPRLSIERCAAFLRAYHAAWPLSVHEIDAIPTAFCSLWLSKRLEGMAKVAPHERYRFFARDVEGPLDWMDANWETVRDASFG